MSEKNKETPLDKRVRGPYQDYHWARSFMAIDHPEFFALAGAQLVPPVPQGVTQTDCAVMQTRKRRASPRNHRPLEALYEFPDYVMEFVPKVLEEGENARRAFGIDTDLPAELQLEAA